MTIVWNLYVHTLRNSNLLRVKCEPSVESWVVSLRNSVQLRNELTCCLIESMTRWKGPTDVDKEKGLNSFRLMNDANTTRKRCPLFLWPLWTKLPKESIYFHFLESFGVLHDEVVHLEIEWVMCRCGSDRIRLCVPNRVSRCCALKCTFTTTKWVFLTDHDMLHLLQNNRSGLVVE